MKKTLLAAALVAGFAGVAQAETSVTLYGILDGGIGYQQVKGNTSYSASRTGATDSKATKTGMINGVQSGNRWGLRGTEDLGNGLQAIFQVESGFDLGTGNQGQSNAQNDRLFGRQATLGLQSDAWGRLDVGRQTNIGSKYFGAIDPFSQGFGQANIGAAFTAVNTVRWDNMVMYQTPSFSGFQFGAGYSFRTSGTQQFKIDGNDDPNNRGITTGLRYANGPLTAALSYDQTKTSGDGFTVRAWNLGAAYDFEVVKLHLAYGQTRNGLFAAESFGSQLPTGQVNAEGLKINSYLVGLTAPLGAGKVMASWHMADPRSNPDAWNGTDLDTDKQQTYSLGYTYDLSKRTNVYAIGSYTKHAQFLPDAKSTVIGVGLRHRF
ncbi:porin [Alcaligenaceae bacterium]|nr:porin [Alcaligenaceae bacterium]